MFLPPGEGVTGLPSDHNRRQRAFRWKQVLAESFTCCASVCVRARGQASSQTTGVQKQNRKKGHALHIEQNNKTQSFTTQTL